MSDPTNHKKVISTVRMKIEIPTFKARGMKFNEEVLLPRRLHLQLEIKINQNYQLNTTTRWNTRGGPGIFKKKNPGLSRRRGNPDISKS